MVEIQLQRVIFQSVLICATLHEEYIMYSSDPDSFSTWADDLLYFYPWDAVDTTRRRLPHWRQNGTIYYVTFRLADSIPQFRLDQLRLERTDWLAMHRNQPMTKDMRQEYYRLFGERVETWLNSGHGSCLLRAPHLRRFVSETLAHFAGQRYDLGAWCIMPNHVHVLLKLLNDFALSDVLHTWKSYSAHQINKLLNRRGLVWQHESYDHIVRSPQSLLRIEQYILNNPVKARLQPGEYETINPDQLWSKN